MTEIAVAVITALAALGGVALANYLGRNKSVHDKIWEKKLDLYNSVISSIYYALTKFQAFQEARSEVAASAYGDAALSETRDEAWKLLHHAFDLTVRTRLLISADFRAIVGRAQRRFAKLGANPLPSEMDDLAYAILPGLLMELTNQAESELRR
jgi:hypothetical protein